MSGNSTPSTMTSEELTFWYDAGTDLLRGRVSYVFSKPRSVSWGVATWSRAVMPSEIRKYGHDDDIEALPDPTAHPWSQTERISRGRKHAPKEVRLHPSGRPLNS